MLKMQDKFSSQIDLIKASDNGEIPSEIHVLPVGEWETGQYGKVTISDMQAEEMVTNFQSNTRAGVPIDVDHDGGEAAGWVKKLIHKAGEGLFAEIEWTSKGLKLLGDKIYRFFSPEFSFNFKDPLTSKDFGPVFIAGTLTNRPLFRQLEAIVGSELLTTEKDNANLSIVISANTDNMNLQDILKKQLSELNQDEKDFLAQHVSELSEEDKTKFQVKEPEADSDDDADAEKAKADKEAADKAAADKVEADKAASEKAEADRKAAEEAKKGKEATISLTASEYEALKTDSLAGREAMQQLIKANVEKEVESNFMFNESTKKGKILPVGRTPLVNLILTLSETQKKLFNEVMDAIPDGKITLGELGGEGGHSTLTASEELDKLIKEYIKANSLKDSDYGTAYVAVSTDPKNKDLVAAKEAEIKGI